MYVAIVSRKDGTLIAGAAMSQRADCVLLNKGPHILATIKMLDNILRRMQDHSTRNRRSSGN